MKKAIKITAVVLAAILLAVILTAGGYVAYVAIQYNRLEDGLELKIENAECAVQTAVTGKSYRAVSYNIGFGAYSPEFSFFMDTGVMDDGTQVAGKYGKAISKEDVEKNTQGSLAAVKNANADFILLQEVDEDSTRSYHINQRQAFALEEYARVYAVNYHSAYLFYPFHDPHGKSNAGIVTLSRVQAESSVRRSLPLATDFSKFFDLDRCVSITRIPVADSEKQFVLINLHLSAYDEGGKIRALQLQTLNEILSSEREAGNYVLAGGDFNHLLRETDFPDEQQTPSWIALFPSDGLTEGFTVYSPSNAPTCRGADIPYTKGINYTCVIDGFIASDNVEISLIETLDLDFAYSDHNPVTIEFSLL